MKIHIFSVLIIVTSYTGMAQIKSEIISEAKIGPVDCRYEKIIDLDKGDTSTSVGMWFQNKENGGFLDYVDIRYIDFIITNDSTDFFDFIKDLKTAFSEMGSKSNINWKSKNYELELYEWDKSLYLLEPEEASGDGYTHLSKSQTEKLINWVESLGVK